VCGGGGGGGGGAVSSVVSAIRVGASGWEGGGCVVVFSAALSGAKCLNRSQHSGIVTPRASVVGVDAVETKCVFVSCGWSAVQDHGTRNGNNSVDRVTPSKCLGTILANKYCIHAESAS